MENIGWSRDDLGPRPTPLRTRTGRPFSTSRRRLLTALQDQAEPVTLASLVLMSGLHENTVRGHLEAMERDRLVTRSRAEPVGRGRPAWLWQATRAEAGSEYAGLASALARTLARSSDQPTQDAHRAGKEWGRELAAGHHPEDAGTPRQRMVGLLEEMGFGPSPTAQHDQEVRLTRCPLLEAARQHPDIVCAVHAGLVDGALAAYGDEDTRSQLVPFAEPGACLLRLGT